MHAVCRNDRGAAGLHRGWRGISKIRIGLYGGGPEKAVAGLW